ncbi:uncharacterized protein LOC131214273 [Anopheles bellator]|uniref:uncharacterized protein LOC131214273 n=1 Tax=Anopheles bellator TaxID=139047 RepID=UPI00264A3368|nr:uncharacterized protein LOC131214273 [Anopheles bellator]
MRLTLNICGLMIGMILVPTHGKLKHAEIITDTTINNHFRATHDHTLQPSQEARKYYTKNDEELRFYNGATVSNDDEEGDEEIAADDDEDDEENNGLGARRMPLPTINCFPPIDRWHMHDWAQHHLSHLARQTIRSSQKNYAEAPWDYTGTTASSTRKRTADFRRELSADFYAQYPSSCACQTKYELLDLGNTHFPRYIVNAICQNRSINSQKCWRGFSCKEIPYKVRVLTKRTDNEPVGESDHHSTLLPEPLREHWRFKTVTIAAACQCSI